MKVFPKLFLRFFLGLCGITVGILILEVLLHLSHPSIHPAGVAEADPFLGWRLHPGVYHFKGQEYDAIYRINSKGMNDVEPAPSVPGTLTMIAVGNSHTMATGVDWNQAWPKVLERLLNEGHSPEKLRVMNFGVGAYSLGQEYLHFMRDGLQFHPKVVIMTVALAADFLIILPPEKDRGFYYSPEKGRAYFVLDQERRLVLKKELVGKTLTGPQTVGSWSQGARDWLDAHSEVYIRFKHSPLAFRLAHLLGKTNATIWPTADFVLSTHLGKQEQYAWDLANGILAQLNKELSARKIRLVVAVIPYFPQVYDSVWNSGFSQDPRYDRFAGNKRMSALCAKNGLECIDVTDAFIKRARDTGRSLHYAIDGHPTPEGQRLIAEELRKHFVTHPTHREPSFLAERISKPWIVFPVR